MYFVEATFALPKYIDRVEIGSRNGLASVCIYAVHSEANPSQPPMEVHP
jgi:hypothetical protein